MYNTFVNTFASVPVKVLQAMSFSMNLIGGGFAFCKTLTATPFMPGIFGDLNHEASGAINSALSPS